MQIDRLVTGRESLYNMGPDYPILLPFKVTFLRQDLVYSVEWRPISLRSRIFLVWSEPGFHPP